MKLEEAVGLIKNEFISAKENQIWADLGCGTGTFTKALSLILPLNSLIYAVDINKSSLKMIPDHFGNSIFEKVSGDFTKIELPLNLDGILMANSLHYVRNKDLYIKKIQSNLNKKGCLIIAEYDLDISTPWIPYPVSFESLKKFFEKKVYTIIKIGEHPSVFRKEKIYSALIKKNI